MKTKQIFEDNEWAYILTLLPPNLEEIAAQTKALTRRRNIPNAATLLRIALAYAVSDLSLKDVAAWATSANLAEVSGPALFYRIRESENLLQYLLIEILANESERYAVKGYKIRVVDGTVVNGPKPENIDWRVHLLCDPISGKFVSAEITDKYSAEGLTRHPFNPGEVVLGDRMYSTARGIYEVRNKDAHVLVRLNPHALRVCDEHRQTIDLLAFEKEVPDIGAKEFKILIPVPPKRNPKNHSTWPLGKAVDWIPARVFAARTKGKKVLWILTTLPCSELTPANALKLYRLRWQVELIFKRLKSLLDFDSLPSQKGPTAKSWLLARLLAAALAQKLVDPSGALSPWGYELHEVQSNA